MMNARRRHEEITRLLDRIEVSLLVRDPGTVRSVEAYEGLRKTMVAAAQERTMHLVQLAQFDAALAKTDDIATLRQLITEWMEQAGLVKVNDPAYRDAFEIVEGKGETLDIVIPAYVDSATSRVIKQGQARAVQAAMAGDRPGLESGAGPKGALSADEFFETPADDENLNAAAESEVEEA